MFVVDVVREEKHRCRVGSRGFNNWTSDPEPKAQQSRGLAATIPTKLFSPGWGWPTGGTPLFVVAQRYRRVHAPYPTQVLQRHFYGP